MTVQHADLAVFVDRATVRYDRRYPHPIDLVFEAVSTSEHLDVWMLPVSRVERRPGGRCSFTWGGPEGEGEGGAQVGVVADFEPPRLITYAFDDPPSWFRFELEPVDGAGGKPGTLLHFTLHWPIPAGQLNEADDYPGGDLPAGPGTAWRPGFLSGFHEMLGDLEGFLSGTWTAADRAAHLAAFPQPGYLALVDAYREHV
ncbi:MAG TPA: SRPBCC domain-containing protein, partial [Acidimicrobiales bacterium]